MVEQETTIVTPQMHAKCMTEIIMFLQQMRVKYNLPIDVDAYSGYFNGEICWFHMLGQYGYSLNSSGSHAGNEFSFATDTETKLFKLRVGLEKALDEVRKDTLFMWRRDRMSNDERCKRLGIGIIHLQRLLTEIEATHPDPLKKLEIERANQF
jgi:hypothetical protein